MASELRVNTSSNRVGLGTITYTDTGPIISGITTGDNFKTGTTNVHSTGVELTNINTGGGTATFGGNLSIAEKIIHTGDTNTFIKLDTDTVTFETGGSEALRIDASQRIGIDYTPGSGDGPFNIDVTGSNNIFHLGHGTNNDNYYTTGASGTQYFRTPSKNQFIIKSDGKIGVATETPTAFLEIRNPADQSGVPVFRVRNHGAAGNWSGNYGSEFRHSFNSLNHGVLIHAEEAADSRRVLDISDSNGIFATFTNGKLGINTTTPDGKLEINASGSAHMLMFSNNGTNFAQFGHNSASGTSVLDIRSEGHMRFLTNGNNEKLRITTAGVVSINDSTPETFATLQIKNHTTHNACQVLLHGADQAQIILRDETGGSNAKCTTIRNDAGQLIFGTHNDAYSSFSEKLRIDLDGKIGLNESSPANYGIHASQSSQSVYYRADSGSVDSIYGSATALGFAIAGTTSNHPFLLYANNAERARILTDGRVGINTTDARFNNGNSAASNQLYTNIPKLGVQGSIVIGNLSSTATDVRELAFYRRGGPATGTAISTHKMGRVAWYGSSNDTAFPDKAWSIECIPNGSGWTAGSNRRAKLSFVNHEHEEVRIDSNGRVGLNQPSESSGRLTIKGTNNNGSTCYAVSNSGKAYEGIDLTSTTCGDGNYGGGISFGCGGNGRSAIAAYQKGSDDDVNGLAFFTHRSNNGGDNTVEAMRIEADTGCLFVNDTNSSNTISSNHRFFVSGIQRQKASGGAAYWDRGFHSMQTGSGSMNHAHVLTDMETDSSAMFVCVVRGYAYGQGRSVFCQTCGYCYSTNDNIINKENKSWDGNTTVESYKSSGGYVAFQFNINGWSSYYLGLVFDIFQPSPAKSHLRHKVSQSAWNSTNHYYS